MKNKVSFALGMTIALSLAWLGELLWRAGGYDYVVGRSLYSTLYDVLLRLLLLVLVVVLILTHKNPKKAPFVVGLLVASALYNMVEMMLFGGVYDYLPGFFNTKSNISDYILVLSLCFVAIDLLQKSRNV